MKWTLASDIDGTLVGSRESLDRLANRLDVLRNAGGLLLIYCTGRRLDQVIDGTETEGLPIPDAVICQVGTEIYLEPNQESASLESWRTKLLSEYSRAEAESFLDGIPGLQMQPHEFNTDLKTSCFVDECPNPDATAAMIAERAARADDRYMVIYSSGRDLDILPASSGKGKAIAFLLQHLGRSHENVVVAGDTGNDSAMFHHFDRGIVVANAQPELIALAEAADAKSVYQAGLPYAAGVEQGLEFFGVLPIKTA
ncbi:HAD-IIB family hydrolase [Stratiformator vulcanicus]|uniref:HAD-IIB family hydrolase n=1 Tax=Stratiformator vulcanicus TaxID=2527980 RepID=UPI002877A55F|nr:HAD-IIB family hydrolase [Stratiformator vulcanicus]